MRTLVSTVLFTSLSIVLAAPAFAEEHDAVPAFALMDNTGDGSKINLDLATIFLRDTYIDVTLIRPSVLGQYIAPNGFGGYAGISVSLLVSEGGPIGTGNLEFGSLYHRSLGSNFDLGVRTGLVLPTMGKQDTLVHTLSTVIARPADLVTVLPDTTWLRSGVSPTYHRGPVFLRADLGVDVPLIDGHGLDPVGHLNLGVGVGDDRFIATAELQTVFVPRGYFDTEKGDSLHTIGFSLRNPGKGSSPFLLVSTPLDAAGVITATVGLTSTF